MSFETLTGQYTYLVNPKPSEKGTRLVLTFGNKGIAASLPEGQGEIEIRSGI